jgi:hypothetical protein
MRRPLQIVDSQVVQPNAAYLPNIATTIGSGGGQAAALSNPNSAGAARRARPGAPRSLAPAARRTGGRCARLPAGALAMEPRKFPINLLRLQCNPLDSI